VHRPSEAAEQRFRGGGPIRLASGAAGGVLLGGSAACHPQPRVEGELGGETHALALRRAFARRLVTIAVSAAAVPGAGGSTRTASWGS